MDVPPGQQWPNNEQFDLLHGVDANADFADFLDLDLNQEFPIFGAEHGVQGADEASHSQTIQDVLDPHLMAQHGQFHIQHLTQDAHNKRGVDFGLESSQHAGAFNIQSNRQFEQLQQQARQQQQQLHGGQGTMFSHGEPPTPNSSKMHSDAQAYLQHMDAQSRAVLEQQYQMRKGEMMNFTPLVSPAVTPRDPRFQIAQDFTTVPGAYFSPLTSPALNGHVPPALGSHTPQFHPSAPHSTSSNTASPIDLDVEMLGEPVVAQPAPLPTRKSTRKRPGTSGSASHRIRQSPVVKAQSKHKSAGLSPITTKDVSGLSTDSQHSHLNSPLQRISNSDLLGHTNLASSASPDPHADASMGPPPKPGSALQSPAIPPQSEQLKPLQAGTTPATPASLMRISNGENGSPLTQTMQSPMSPSGMLTRNGGSLEDLRLPESAVGGSNYGKGSSSSVKPKVVATAQNSLSMPALGTPCASPVSPNFVAGSKRGSTSDVKSGRGKKRNSTSITEGRPATSTNGSSSTPLISPALRPKIISPSIKPMVPTSASLSGTPNIAASTAGPLTISEQTAHLLLASKSNYQHLVDGTNVNVPGLEYPESLSTGLTSKRTSHKIAEQGRRNRINVALAEMGRLLPTELKGTKSPVITAQDGKTTNGTTSINPKTKKGAVSQEEGNGGGANAGNSKAATVESAIVYIKMLQQQAQERDKEIRQREQEISDLRKKLNGTEINPPERESASDDDAKETREQTVPTNVNDMELEPEGGAVRAGHAVGEDVVK